MLIEKEGSNTKLKLRERKKANKKLTQVFIFRNHEMVNRSKIYPSKIRRKIIS